MRFVVLLFGFLGVLMTAVGAIAMFYWDLVLENVHEFYKDVGTLPLAPTGPTSGNAAIFALIVTMYGLLGVILAFFRCGKQGGALIIISVLMAMLVNPYLTPFVALLGFTGLIALFVGPLPLNAPAKKKAADYDDDDED